MKKRFMVLAVIVIAALLIPAFKGFSVSAAEDTKVETEVEDTATDLSVKTEVDDPEILPDEGEVTAVDLNPSYWEKESNNQLTSATEIPYLNTGIGGTLSSSSDEDWFSFKLSKPGYVRLSLCHGYVDSSSTYWRASLYTDQIDSLFTVNFAGNALDEAFSGYVGLDAGTYYVKVNDYYYSGETYVLKINYTASNYWEKEFNETIVAANSIKTDTTYYGTLRTSSDTDWYTFDLPYDGYVWLTFGHDYVDSSSTYWKTTIFNSSNESFATDEWRGNATVDYDTYCYGLKAGTYYVRVTDYYDSNLPYHFQVNYEKSKAWEKEFNQTIVNANPVNVNTYVYGSLMTSSDNDWYSFNIPYAGMVRVAFTHDYVNSSSNYWRTDIYDSENTSLKNAYFSGNAMTVMYSDPVNVQPGTYYLKVSPYYDSRATYRAIVEYTTTGSFDNIVYIDPDKETVSITQHPKSATVNPGQLAKFSVTAKGTGLSYLWQYKYAGASSWTNWTSKTTASIDVAYADYRNGMSLRCMVTNSDGDKVYTNTATLKYNDGVFFSSQPQSVTVSAGSSADFSVVAYGSGFKYQWQYKLAGDSSWTTWSSKTTAKINVAYAAYRNGMSLRCIVTDSKGNSATSNTATLKYASELSITSQPQNTTVGVNELAYFSVTAKGNGLKYQWQYKNAGASSWTTWSSKTTASISVAYSASRNGMSLRCIVTDSEGKSVTSNTAVLTYKSNLAITTQPSNSTVMHGELAYFSVKASGSGLKYLWQYKNAGASSWTNWTSKTTASISVAYSASRNGMSLRCIVTDSSGTSVISNTVTLKYKSGIKITSQPESTTVNKNEVAYFGIKAAGTGIKYQWQYKYKGESSWTNWGSKTTANISVAYADYRNGMSLRCVVTDSDGNIDFSNTAVLTYK
ncbi:MAG: hypothetical protein K6E47_00265 [Lachnospiraceae bacterium]|nr:hypothetical protein [Lachnospiraceae bacterium]